MSPIQISQITSILSALALLWLAVVVPVGMALLWRAHKRLVRGQTAAIVKYLKVQIIRAGDSEGSPVIAEYHPFRPNSGEGRMADEIKAKLEAQDDSA